MKKFYLIVLLLSICAQAQVPAYYQSVDFTNSSNEIKQDLNFLLRNTHFTKLSYTPGVWNALKQADLDPENLDNVLLIYGSNDQDVDLVNDRSRDKDLTCPRTECVGRWNREHVYPKSIGQFSPDGFEYTDIHALRAADTEMNSYRFNYPFIDGSGEATLISNNRFYPGDEWRGDVARMILYMYLRYPNKCKPNYVGDDANTFSAEVPDIFLRWNVEDPVSEFEKRRNNLVEELQGNRNPLIDNPYIATLIWGGPKAEDTWGTLSTQELEIEAFEYYPNPTTSIIHYKEEGFSSILIFDAVGRLVGKDLNLNNNQTTMPDAKGLYWVEFCKENQCTTIQVIKK